MLDIRKQLEKITAEGDVSNTAVDLLKMLSKLKVDLGLLTSTRIGMTVNALRFEGKHHSFRSVLKVTTVVLLLN